VDFSELFVYVDTDDRAGAVAELGDDEDPLPGIRDDLIDLEPTLRDAVVLGLPLSPVCREECAGLCSECGVRLDSAPGHAHELTDPRWAALAGLVEPDKQ
ncbi:MAG: YceD family protein, partial [Candidatus Nanopelagicales bacterium]